MTPPRDPHARCLRVPPEDYLVNMPALRPVLDRLWPKIADVLNHLPPDPRQHMPRYVDATDCLLAHVFAQATPEARYMTLWSLVNGLVMVSVDHRQHHRQGPAADLRQSLN